MLGLTHADEDDDDNHLCIKCNSTIIGLDNYVKHRKARCNQMKNESNINAPPNHQGADVFFQSLELQSSAKKPPIPLATSPSVGGKTGAGVLTRRATAAMLSTTGKEIYTNTEQPSHSATRKRGEDWIGGHELQVTGIEDNQTKLIKAVANICEQAKKVHIPSNFTLIPEYKQEDDDEDDSEDSDELEDDDPIHSGGKWKPHPSHTGGKWKPLFISRESTSHWPSTSAITPDLDHNDDWEEEHTGGKWKPFMNQHVETLTRLEKIHEIDEDEDDEYMPPPGHTKGKWIPGANDSLKQDHKAQIMDVTPLHKDGGSVQYWCGPCNRRLGSRNNYEKHLRSNLHVKRTLPEKFLEFSGTLKTGNETILGKRSSKPSLYLNESIYLHTTRQKKRKLKAIENDLLKPKRRRRPNLLVCTVCRYRTKPFLMGKHLISHYHFRKANTNDEFYKTQILENIHRIVRQAPFQCSPCKFYTNWQTEFLLHWKSEDHEYIVDNMTGAFWCSFCKFECENSVRFEEHLHGRDHQDVVAAINRSIPIIIRKKSIIRCEVCDKSFKYNMQLKRHGKYFCRGKITATATDEYQGKKKCSQCNFTSKSSVSLTIHMRKRHSGKVFICSACSVEFPNAAEAKAHRKSQEHRVKSIEKRIEKGLQEKDISKACPHCDTPRFKNILELKSHIEENHKEAFYSCSSCGMKFALPQEVSWHMRNQACTFSSNTSRYSDKQIWNCRICPFVTGSQAECIYHEVLHGSPVVECDDDGTNRQAEKYTCPGCQKAFPKHSLRYHLRVHTNERPHSCGECGAAFFRKSNLIFHVKRSHSTTRTAEPQQPDKSSPEPTTEEALKPFMCSICMARFSKKYALKLHTTLHAGRGWSCPIAGCLHTARNPSDLRAHQTAAHSTARPFTCSQCSYAAKTKIQLSRHLKIHLDNREKKVQCPYCTYKTEQQGRMQRHLRLHTGAKPYACPHCSFTCNNLENLRKHVLSRNKHKNKFLYECDHCSEPTKYGTNFAKDFRVHLTVVHPSLYPDHRSTASYVTNYLKVELPTDNILKSEINLNEMKIVMPADPPLRINDPYQVENVYKERSEQTAILEFSSEECYSVTETGILVPDVENK